MIKIEIIDVTLETELGNFIYESNMIPKRNDIVSINSNTYVITDIIHNINSEVNVTLLAQPVVFQYGEYLH